MNRCSAPSSSRALPRWCGRRDYSGSGRRDLEEFRRGLDIVDGNLAQSRVADQSLINEGPDRIELLVRRDTGIDPVQLPQIDLLDAEIAQALVYLLEQIFRPSDRLPDVRSRTGQPSLRRDDEVFGIGMQRLPDQPFRDIRSVGIRRVDEVDAEFGKMFQRADGFIMVGGWSPYPRPRNAHGAEAQPVDF